MKTASIDSEEILAQCRKLVSAQGIEAVDMRTVASACNVSVGSVYRYFPNKSELLLHTVASVWNDILQDAGEFNHFSEALDWFYNALRKGQKKYPGFLQVHGQSINASEGSRKHSQCLKQVRDILMQALQTDPDVDQSVFDEDMPKEKFLDTVILSASALAQRKEKDCSVLQEMISRCLKYRRNR